MRQPDLLLSCFHLLPTQCPCPAAIIRRASTFDDLYYPFSSNPLVAPSVAIPWGGALIDNLDNLFNKDYQLAHSYNTPRRGASVMPGRLPQ